MQTSVEVQRAVAGLGASAWAFAALCAARESGILAQLDAPRDNATLGARTGVPSDLVAAVLDVLVATGLVERDGDQFVAVPGLVPLLTGPAGEQFAENLRSQSLQSQAMIADARAGTLAPGWRHTDLATLRAQGLATAPIFQFLSRTTFPQLAELEARLHAPTASFLDVGSGVGAVALVMCGLYPQLRVVGLEPQEIPRAESARLIPEAGLADRVTIRPQLVEDLDDRDAFDLIWLPQVFLPDEAYQRSLRTTLAALRPGGWLVLVTGSLPGAELGPAVARLVNALVGGSRRLPEDVAATVDEAGFARVRIFPGPPGSPFNFIAGQRPG